MGTVLPPVKGSLPATVEEGATAAGGATELLGATLDGVVASVVELSQSLGAFTVALRDSPGATPFPHRPSAVTVTWAGWGVPSSTAPLKLKLFAGENEPCWTSLPLTVTPMSGLVLLSGVGPFQAVTV